MNKCWLGTAFVSSLQATWPASPNKTVYVFSRQPQIFLLPAKLLSSKVRKIRPLRVERVEGDTY